MTKESNSKLDSLDKKIDNSKGNEEDSPSQEVSSAEAVKANHYHLRREGPIAGNSYQLMSFANETLFGFSNHYHNLSRDLSSPDSFKTLDGPIPATIHPTVQPTPGPSLFPTPIPSIAPSEEPTAFPTYYPTSSLTSATPTASDTFQPTNSIARSSNGININEDGVIAGSVLGFAVITLAVIGCCCRVARSAPVRDREYEGAGYDDIEIQIRDGNQTGGR